MTEEYEAEEYKRSYEDELDWSEIEQLHAATLQMSNSCLEYKKACVSFLTAAIAAFVTLAKGQFSKNIFIVVAIIVLGFWLSDSTSYYYQRVLRIRMKNMKEKIAKRNKQKHISDGQGVIETQQPQESEGEDPEKSKRKAKLDKLLSKLKDKFKKDTEVLEAFIGALFNLSMILYYVLIGLSAIGWFSYGYGWVK